jgi:hypothetical protein
VQIAQHAEKHAFSHKVLLTILTHQHGCPASAPTPITPAPVFFHRS